MTLALVSLLCAARAQADPPIAQLVGARIYLSTTAIPVDILSIAETRTGFVVRRGKLGPATISVPSTILTGYIRTTNFDPPIVISNETKPGDVARRGKASFVEERNLVKIKYPRPGLVSINVQDLYISTGVITKVESSSGTFNRYSAYGEPFFVPEWQAKLLSGQPPVYHCTPPTERQELVWVSYNKSVGEAEMKEICESVDFESAALRDLMAKENVFGIIYPAD
jgi:hypothetical protein